MLKATPAQVAAMESIDPQLQAAEDTCTGKDLGAQSRPALQDISQQHRSQGV